MALFSWFIGNQKAGKIDKRNSQLDSKQASFTLSTMWPTAKVRRNPIVKQQEFTNARQQTKDNNLTATLTEKES